VDLVHVFELFHIARLAGIYGREKDEPLGRAGHVGGHDFVRNVPASFCAFKSEHDGDVNSFGFAQVIFRRKFPQIGIDVAAATVIENLLAPVGLIVKKVCVYVYYHNRVFSVPGTWKQTEWFRAI
jgi:hypothetical protein